MLTYFSPAPDMVDAGNGQQGEPIDGRENEVTNSNVDDEDIRRRTQ